MKDILALVLSGQVLSESQASFALEQILSGSVPPPQAAAFLAIIQARGLNLSELQGFQRFLRDNGLAINFTDYQTIDVCGTGGDGKNTFNISTLAAFVVAGAGYKVSKHGNSSATSGCGSSDVLEALGVKFSNDESVLRQQLETANICYLHAPLFQPILKQIAPLRREIGFRTFFNLLGPLLNPAKPKYQFIGVAEPGVLRLYRYFLEDSGQQFAIVHSRDGYDEISLTSVFDVVTDKGSETFYPEDLGFESVLPNELQGEKTAQECAQQLYSILQNQGTKSQNSVVIANAAFAINLLEPELSFESCAGMAGESLHSGKALKALDNLRKF